MPPVSTAHEHSLRCVVRIYVGLWVTNGERQTEGSKQMKEHELSETGLSPGFGGKSEAEREGDREWTWKGKGAKGGRAR